MVGSFGRSEAKKGCVGITSGGGRNCDATDLAFGVGVGSQFARHLGVELNYANLGKVRAIGGPGTSATQELSASIFDLTGLGILPLTEGFSAYAKLGGYRANLETTVRGVADSNNYGLTYGGGLQLDLNRRLAVRGQWQ